jgi:hypothetical protein
MLCGRSIHYIRGRLSSSVVGYFVLCWQPVVPKMGAITENRNRIRI